MTPADEGIAAGRREPAAITLSLGARSQAILAAALRDRMARILEAIEASRAVGCEAAAQALIAEHNAASDMLALVLS